MSAPERAPLGAALALLVTLVSLTGSLSSTLLAGCIAGCAVMVALGWPELLELPSRRGTSIVAALTGAGAAGIALTSVTRSGPLSGVLVVCALGVLGSFAQQMLRRDRRGLTESLTGTVAAVLLTGFGGCWVLAMRTALDAHAVGLIAAIAAGSAATLLLTAAPVPRIVAFALAVIAGTATTWAVAAYGFGVDPLLAGMLGLVVAVAAAGCHLLLSSLIVSDEPGPALAVAAAPVLTVGVIAQLAIPLARAFTTL